MKKLLILLVLMPSILLGQDFRSPESVTYDDESGYYFISNVGQFNTPDGFIKKRSYLGELTGFVDNGLNDPKGMAVYDGKLFVADVNKLVIIEISSGKILEEIAIEGAQFLNGVVSDGSGIIYISDTSTGRVYRYDTGSGTGEFMALDKNLPGINGMEMIDGKIYAVIFAENSPVYEINPADMTATIVKNTPLDNADGITTDNNGNIYISSWGKGQAQAGGGLVARYMPGFSGDEEVYINGLTSPADIYFNKYLNELAIPEMNVNKVSFIQISDKPDAPELISPDENRDDITIVGHEFSWSSSENADKYRLEVATNISFSEMVGKLETENTEAYFDFELKEFTTYFWKVTAVNSEGETASIIRSFETVNSSYEEIAAITPANGTQTSLSPEFFWEEGDGEFYHLQIDINPQFNSQELINERTIPGTSIQISQVLRNEVEYYWRVRTYRDNISSPWSEVITFTPMSENAITAVLLTAPNDGATGVPPLTSFLWKPSANAVRYELVISTVESSEPIIIPIEGGSILNHTLTEPLEPSTNYNWAVDAFNSDGQSARSEVWSFVTADEGSVKELSTANDIIKIFPVPAQSNLKFDISPEILPDRLEIRDIFGKICFESDISSPSGSVNIERLPPGSYLFVIRGEDIYSIPFIKR